MTKEEAIEILVEQFRQKLIDSHEELTAYAFVKSNKSERFKYYLNIIADYFCLDVKDITETRSRLTDVKKARQILWWFCRTGETNLKWSLSKIGKETCSVHDYNHATVLHGVRAVSNDIDYDHITKQDVKAITESLGMKLVKVGANWTTQIK